MKRGYRGSPSVISGDVSDWPSGDRRTGNASGLLVLWVIRMVPRQVHDLVHDLKSFDDSSVDGVLLVEMGR